MKPHCFLNLISSFHKKSTTSAAANESSGSGGDEPSSWNMGQDDSAVHGKHLPPSPRRQLNKSSLKMSKTAAPAAQGAKPPQPQLHQPNLGPKPGDRHSYSPLMFHKVTPTPSPPTYHSRSRSTSETQAGAEPPQVSNPSASTSILRRKVLSKETAKNYQEKALLRYGSRGRQENPGRSRICQSTMQVPWEKEASKDGTLGLGLCLGQAAVPQDGGLLEEIDSMCCLGSVVSSNLPQVHCNSSGTRLDRRNQPQ